MSQHYNWLEIFVDGEEFIISLMNDKDDTLYKSLWSNDPYLSVITYNANVGELLFAKVGQLLHSEMSKKEIGEELKRLRIKILYWNRYAKNQSFYLLTQNILQRR